MELLLDDVGPDVNGIDSPFLLVRRPANISFSLGEGRLGGCSSSICRELFLFDFSLLLLADLDVGRR